jgi:hypothetical protein
MVETKYDKSHHAGGTPEARIANRLKPSAGAGAGDYQVTKGSSPNRTVTTGHHSAGHLRPPAQETSGTVKVDERSRTQGGGGNP